ncbi:unnamed protein product [Fraxinus pennsylvanica]|uniref:Uncharacterized protein n=1 Tax=Fraxinus pennsylvanica TaxID=56036 RepID=A0AAD1YT48_9LAMI|nr:unnamed protein product [Fraxinus pennsylvanica]
MAIVLRFCCFMFFAFAIMSSASNTQAISFSGRELEEIEMEGRSLRVSLTDYSGATANRGHDPMTSVSRAPVSRARGRKLFTASKYVCSNHKKQISPFIEQLNTVVIDNNDVQTLKYERGKICILNMDSNGMRNIISGKTLSYLEMVLKNKSGNLAAKMASEEFSQ